MLEKNYLTVALIILYIKEKEKCPGYISKINLDCEKTNNSINDSKWRKSSLELSYSKKLSGLLRGIISKDYGDFYCLNYLHSFRTENKLKSYEKVCKNKDFGGIVMPSEKDNILEFN